MLIESNQHVNSNQQNRPVMSLSAFSIQGKRSHMEDYYDIGYQMKPVDQRAPNEWPYEYFYFGIFDGHGGHEAASYAKKNLLKYITRQSCFWSDNDDDVMRAIRQGFAETHSAMKRDMHTWSKTSRVLPSTAGTTASILFIKNGKFYTGHVGDSRIVVSNQNPETKHWISNQLTEDHKPESEIESGRIRRAGGEVKSKIGVHRVVWRRPLLVPYLNQPVWAPTFSFEEKHDDEDKINSIHTYPVEESLVTSYQTIPFLAIARSLGDFWSINPYSGQYIVSPEPDVSCRPIDKNDKSILLATDGLWNVMNSSMACRFLQELNISKNGNRQYYENEYFTTDNFYDVAGQDSENHAQSLVYFAYQMWERRRLRSDNITVVVVMLHDILDYFQDKTLGIKNNCKTYQTRSASLETTICAINDKTHSEPKSKTKQATLVQLEQTNCFVEKIKVNSEPLFSRIGQEIPSERWHRLENFLILPPTILEQEQDFKYPKLVYPKNYRRLSNATCRKITGGSRIYGDYVILIKQVSDDPADEQEGPIRISKSGKEVRDSSCQATQSIHDFGQPWDQLLDDNLEQDEFNNDTIGLLELVEKFANDGNEDEEEESFIDPIDEDVDEMFTEVKHKDDESIPQLRCLLNHTPPLRRSQRHSYMSVSDNAKRKAQLNATQAMPKSKRRKSQPVRCSVRA